VCHWTQPRTILLWYVDVSSSCICLISVHCSISFSFIIACDWTQPCTILLWYVDVLSCFIYLRTPRSISFFLLLCVAGYSAARISCGMWMSSPVVFAWLRYLVAYHFLLPLFFCVTGHSAARFSCGMWFLPSVVFVCLISVLRSISFSYTTVCDWT